MGEQVTRGLITSTPCLNSSNRNSHHLSHMTAKDMSQVCLVVPVYRRNHARFQPSLQARTSSACQYSRPKLNSFDRYLGQCDAVLGIVWALASIRVGPSPYLQGSSNFSICSRKSGAKYWSLKYVMSRSQWLISLSFFLKSSRHCHFYIRAKSLCDVPLNMVISPSRWFLRRQFVYILCSKHFIRRSQI